MRLVLAMVAILMAGCSLQEDIAAAAPNQGPLNVAAPPLVATTLVGGQFSLDSQLGHPVLLDFWATWCGPCRALQADINKLVAQDQPLGLVAMGIDVRDDQASALAFERDFSVPYGSIADSDGAISGQFDVVAPPTIVLIDPSGKIVGRYFGTLVGLDEGVAKWLKHQ